MGFPVISFLTPRLSGSDIVLAVGRFLRLRQTIYERVKECHEEGSNSRELADQRRDLITRRTVFDRRCELL